MAGEEYPSQHASHRHSATWLVMQYHFLLRLRSTPALSRIVCIYAQSWPCKTRSANAVRMDGSRSANADSYDDTISVYHESSPIIPFNPLKQGDLQIHRPHQRCLCQRSIRGCEQPIPRSIEMRCAIDGYSRTFLWTGMPKTRYSATSLS